MAGVFNSWLTAREQFLPRIYIRKLPFEFFGECDILRPLYSLLRR